MTMSGDISPKPRGRPRGRPFEKGRSGNPRGRRPGSRNKATIAAAALLEGESEALTRKAVEMALKGDPTALRLCMERLLPPCRERSVALRLPPIGSARPAENRQPSPHDVSLAMDAVVSALARGEITPGEADRIAAVVGTFVGAVETTQRGSSRLNMLQILTAADDDEDSSDDEFDGGDDEEIGDYEEPNDCDC
jgi:Family of unknown function (DUF5681)